MIFANLGFTDMESNSPSAIAPSIPAFVAYGQTARPSSAGKPICAHPQDNYHFHLEKADGDRQAILLEDSIVLNQQFTSMCILHGQQPIDLPSLL